MHSGADLEQEPDDRKLVADALEIELFEEIRGLEPVPAAEMVESLREPGIVFEGRKHARRL